MEYNSLSCCSVPVLYLDFPLHDNCVLWHVNPAAALLWVLTPCHASQEAVKDPVVYHFKLELYQSVSLSSEL